MANRNGTLGGGEAALDNATGYRDGMWRVRLLRRSLVALAGAGALVAATAASGQAAPAAIDPSRLAHVGDAGQVIIVTAPSWRSTTGTLRAFERDGSGGWREVVAATPAWLGYGGLVLGTQRKQGTGTTPAGTYAITSAFGSLPDPGTRLPYRAFDRNDSWTYDPDHPFTYNVFQTAPSTGAPTAATPSTWRPRARSTATSPSSTSTCRPDRSPRAPTGFGAQRPLRTPSAGAGSSCT